MLPIFYITSKSANYDIGCKYVNYFNNIEFKKLININKTNN